ncbi:MAG: hypothetical protein LBU32_01030 [Clostridiales bacterium]|nr:hypothetical protein [Clostridiales bacterium]
MNKLKISIIFFLIHLAVLGVCCIPINAATDPAKPAKLIAFSNLGLNSKYQYTAAVDADGVLWIWGLYLNKDGKAAYCNVYQDKPLRVMDDVESITDEFSEIHALKKDGTLWACTGTMENEWGATEHFILQTPVKLLDDVKPLAEDTGYIASSGKEKHWWYAGRTTEVMEKGRVITIGQFDRTVDATPSQRRLKGRHFAITSESILWQWAEVSKDKTLPNAPADNIVRVMDDAVDAVRVEHTGVYFCYVLQKDGTVWSYKDEWEYTFDGAEVPNGYRLTNTPKKIISDVQYLTYINKTAHNSFSGEDISDATCLAVKNDGSLWFWNSSPEGVASDPEKLLDNVEKIRKFWFPMLYEKATGLASSGERAYIIQSDATMHTFFDKLEKSQTGVADLWEGSRAAYHDVYYDNGYILFTDGTLRRAEMLETILLTGVAEFTVSGYYDCAVIKDDGSLWVWGLNGVWGSDPMEIHINLESVKTLTPRKVLSGMAVE